MLAHLAQATDWPLACMGRRRIIFKAYRENPMVQKVDAIYENGVFRPLDPPQGLADHARVTLRVESAARTRNDLSCCVGSLPDEDAAELTRIIESEFERVDPREWQ
jgi:predicted DNA-binding antitoxin AbrB/MazE fold protein